MPKISTKDWRNLPIEQWNVTTFHAYLAELTADHFGVEYAPTGSGSKSQRWAREKGMMKQAQERYGNEVLRRFIEMCVSEYKPKAQYPYVSFTFMYSYMDRNFAKAQAELAAQNRRKEAEQTAREDMADIDELIDYL